MVPQIGIKIAQKAGPKAFRLLRAIWSRGTAKLAGVIAAHPKLWKVAKFAGSIAAWAGVDWLINKAVDNGDVDRGEIGESTFESYVDAMTGFMPDASELLGPDCLGALQIITSNGTSITIGRAIDATTEAAASLSADDNLSAENAVRFGAIDLYLRRLRSANGDAAAAMPSDVEAYKIASWYAVAMLEELAESDPENAKLIQKYIAFHFSSGESLTDDEIRRARDLELPDFSSSDDPKGQRWGNHLYCYSKIVVAAANEMSEDDLCALELSYMYAYLVAMAHRASEGKDVEVLFS